MLLKLPWLAVDVFVDIFGKISGQFDRRSSRPWLLHIHLALSFADDLAPIAAKETNILLGSNSKCNTAGPEGLRCCHAKEIVYALERRRP